MHNVFCIELQSFVVSYLGSLVILFIYEVPQMLYLHLSFKDWTCTTVTLVNWLLNPKAHSQIHLFFNFYNYHQDSFLNVDARSTISVPAFQELLCGCIFFQVLSVLVKWNQHMNWHRTGIRKCRSFQFRLESDPLITISVLCGLFSMLAQKIGDKDLMQPPKTQIVQVCSHSSQSPMTNLFSSHGWVSFMISTNYKAGRKSSCFEQNWKPWEICFL